MAENKTKPVRKSVDAFLNKIKNEKQKKDSLILVKMMESVTRTKPVLWGESIVGFGIYHYKYASGREGNWFLTGFSPRKDSISIYSNVYVENHAGLLEQLGKHKTGKGCIYIKSLDDIDTKVLKKIISNSVKILKDISRKQNKA